MKGSPGVVIFVNGGLVQGAISNMPVDILVVDSDVDGADEPLKKYVDRDSEFEANAYDETPLISKKLVEENFRRYNLSTQWGGRIMKVDVVVCMFKGVVDEAMVFSGEDREKNALTAISEWVGEDFETKADFEAWSNNQVEGDSNYQVYWCETEDRRD